MQHIEIGINPDTGAVAALPLRLANRHGLITGSTGSGKTTSLQRMMEEFSDAGVPVFAADAKGDLSGVAAERNENNAAIMKQSALVNRIQAPQARPVAFWDLFGAHGNRITTSVQAMGAQMLSSMLNLNETQAGAMAIAFQMSERDADFMLTLDDLRATLSEMLEERETVCRMYGNVTASSISAIQRNLLALESQGGDMLFAEPPFSIHHLLKVNSEGRGFINLLHADRLLEAPKLYATFLYWLLTELFRTLPEVGDLDKPKIAFFFDEAHLLFKDAPKPLLASIERLVRLVRSKGVAVFFVTQSPSDIPESVAEQLGTKVLHSMRAHTAGSLRKIRAVADGVRPREGIDVKELLPKLAVGQALISVIDETNTPSPVDLVLVIPPTGQVGPISDLERRVLAVMTSPKIGDEPSQNRAFRDRMRFDRGLPAIVEAASAYQAGDFAKYLPDADDGYEAPPRRWVAILAAVLWLALAGVGLSVAWVALS